MAYLLLFLLFPMAAWASPAEEPEDQDIAILDRAQQLFGNRANSVANNLDMFFANQRADDELGRSRLRLRYNYKVQERSNGDGNYQIRFNIRLPHLEDKFRLQWQERKKKEKQKKKGEKKEKVTTDSTGSKLDKSWLFRADAGISVAVPPNIVTRARLRKSFETGDIIHRFVEEVDWYSNRDFEQVELLTSDIVLTDDWLFRFSNSRLWKITRKDFATGHGPGFFHRLSDNDAISYQLNMSTIVLESTWYVSNYQLNTTYRRNLYKQWLFWDVVPGIDFPKQYSFRRTPFIFMQIEALFGGF